MAVYRCGACGESVLRGYQHCPVCDARAEIARLTEENRLLVAFAEAERRMRLMNRSESVRQPYLKASAAIEPILARHRDGANE